MRFHICQTSKTRNLLIGDSQIKSLVFPNFCIISIPGGRVCHVRNFIPQQGEFDTITLFIGANDLFNGELPSARTPKDVAQETSILADELVPLARKVFVIGLPPRLKQSERTKAVNSVLAAEEKAWKFRGISGVIYCDKKQTEKDNVHLTEKALSGLKSVLKNKVLYKQFCAEISKESHPQNFFVETTFVNAVIGIIEIVFCKINLPTVSFSGFYTDRELFTRLLPLVPSQESTGTRKDSCYILTGSFSGILRNFFGSLADMSGAKFKAPPPWEDGKAFEKWDEEVKLWQLVTDLQKTQQAPALALSL